MTHAVNHQPDGRHLGTPRGGGPSWTLMLGVWSLVFVLVWSVFRPDSASPLRQADAVARAVTPRGDLGDDELATINVFREVSPSVVHITTSDVGRDLFGLNVFEIPRGTGSGFVYDKEGHIVTNFHVVYGSDIVSVRLADGSVWNAKKVGEEPDKDIAVLKIDAPKSSLTPIVMGTSHDLVVGQKVLAIGNPFGLDQTLTVGVVSALGREIESLTDRKIHGVIQTDAAINPGNSGGPLLDSAGRLIGINTQIASPSGASAGIGFAVPVDIVREIVPDLLRYGRVRKPALGVFFVDDSITRRLRLPGVLIDKVVAGSGAAEGGLRGTILDRRGYVRQLGDIVVEIDGQQVGTINEVRDVLEQKEAGEFVTVTFIRDDELKTSRIRLKFNTE